MAICNQLSTCEECRDASCDTCKRFIRRQKANRSRRERDEAIRSLGLTKVRGDRGGVYWE